MGVELHKKRSRQAQVITAVLVGAAVMPLTGAVGRFLSFSGIGEGICSGGLECILPVLLTAYAVATVAAWAALALLGVRPAWRVTLGGSVLSAVIVVATLRLYPPGYFWIITAATAACFALAAWVSSRSSAGSARYSGTPADAP
ncbi:hypothetical protein [Herbidospora sp. NBRC 101105]|uniref:hypothetical protein n=1 Tax=Herbidospora sp. NBRC 101105 TaxID=3032195 RepID=UPI0024A4A868|nr:hypothetical protein [Herbidospora sp. NBRC 101105]GLX96010.1 hypothetical protein Hesp01_39600 [Herbidospora sp. NBRC 101105]